MIDIGTKAEVTFAGSNFFPNEKQTKFRKDCLQFYVTAINYLQEKLPFNVPILKHTQFLHPDKQNDSGATSAISNVSLKICSVVKNCLSTVFSVSDPATKEHVVDRIMNQWLLFQNEDLPEHWYLNTNDQQPSSSNQNSYWKRVKEESGLQATANSKYIYKRLNCFWNHIGKIRDDQGSLKYVQLFVLVKCVLSLSHGNSTPERGFSISKQMLEAHGCTIYQETLEALRFVKDELNQVGGVFNFDITCFFLDEVKLSRSRYEADRIERKALEEK